MLRTAKETVCLLCLLLAVGVTTIQVAAGILSAQPYCTHKMLPCGVYMTLFGKCCLQAGGLQSGRPPNPGEYRNCVPVNDPPQCGAEFQFLPPFFPCGLFTGNFCGGIACSPDCR